MGTKETPQSSANPNETMKYGSTFDMKKQSLQIPIRKDFSLQHFQGTSHHTHYLAFCKRRVPVFASSNSCFKLETCGRSSWPGGLRFSSPKSLRSLGFAFQKPYEKMRKIIPKRYQTVRPKIKSHLKQNQVLASQPKACLFHVCGFR